jgi:hypothetical protein
MAINQVTQCEPGTPKIHAQIACPVPAAWAQNGHICRKMAYFEVLDGSVAGVAGSAESSTW